jgi:hypothetical protein
VICAFGAFASESPNAKLQSTESNFNSVLLLRSGRTIEGFVAHTETHYVLRRSLGSIEVPRGDVEYVGANLEDVYQYKLARIDRQDPDEHVRLAQWCLSVELHARAIEELECAVRLAPKSPRVQGMLDSAQRTARAVQKAPRAAATPRNATHELPIAPKQAIAPQVLNTALLSSFSVQVQPMLTRSCATAGCHDSSHSGPLTLQRSPRPVAKLTQQNLRSVLAQLDPDVPENSPLLDYSVRPHGNASSSPGSKVVNEPAYSTLLEWVRAVCGMAAPKPEAESEVVVVRNDVPTQQTGQQDPANGEPDSATARHPNLEGVTPRTDPAKGQDPRPQSDRAQSGPRNTVTSLPASPFQPVDPFDPEIFNVQFAPRKK